jgi:hypothetical protein
VTGLVASIYLPLVAALVVTGWEFGWRVPVALGAGTALVVAKAKLDLRRRKAGQAPVAWQVQMLVLTVLGATIGGVLVGGPGFFIGATLGILAGLPPVSVKNKDGVVAPVDFRDPVQRSEIRKAQRAFLIVSAVLLAAAIVLLRVA